MNISSVDPINKIEQVHQDGVLKLFKIVTLSGKEQKLGNEVKGGKGTEQKIKMGASSIVQHMRGSFKKRKIFFI